MSVINQPIQRQGYELVLDRIGEILVDEIDTQYLLSYDQALNGITIFKERCVPMGPEDIPLINVRLDTGEYGTWVGAGEQEEGVYRYMIEVHTLAQTTDSERGDTLAKVKCNRIIGVIRSILTDPRYATLGFADNFIWHRRSLALNFGATGDQDANSVIVGIYALEVKVGEIPSGYVDLPLIEGYETEVRLYNTDKGFKWSLPE